MKKELIFGVIIIAAITLSVTYGYFDKERKEKARVVEVATETQRIKKPDGPYVSIDGAIIEVEVATTTEAVKIGLSGRPTLDLNKGMLFVFPKPYIYSFWMPDMQFPLDIIWINEGGVVDIDHNVPNNFDPAKPVFYTPLSPAQYVLEVNAGVARTSNIAIGSSVTFFEVE